MRAPRPHPFARRLGLPLALLLLPLSGPAAHARPADFLPEKAKPRKKPAKPPKKLDGWFPKLSAGFSFAFSQSQGVVGVADGVTLALGLQLRGGLTYRRGTHAWITKLDVVHTQTKLPNIDPFLKAADELRLSSLYQYRFPRVAWLGVFGGLRLTTPLLPASLVPVKDTALALTRRDGAVLDDTAYAQEPYLLTRSFAPLLFKQLAGLLLKPLGRPWMSIDVRLGVGAVEVWTRDGYRVKDDKDTADVLELAQLQDYVQSGAELQLEIGGTLAGKLLSYAFTAEVMYPFVTSVETDLSGAALFNTELRFALGIKLWKWASLNYRLAVLRLPLIAEEWQVTNSLMLTITASLVN